MQSHWVIKLMNESQNIEWKESWRDEYFKWNCGQLPENWSVKNLMQKHASEPYNPDIANACHLAGLPAPAFEYAHTGLWTVFSFAIQANVRKETRVETPEKIINLLRENPHFSLAEVASHIGKSISAVERATAKMVKQGRLQFVGPKKGGYWQILK